jgi:hypothetical protein
VAERSGHGEAWWRTLVFTLVFAVLLVEAAAVMFSVFMFYDDEGYVLISLRNFAEHGALYRDVYSQYGPFPFVLYAGLHALGLPFTHVAERIVTLVAWGGAALAGAAWARHATRSLSVSLAVLASVFGYLWVMTSEPCHPGGLIALLTALLAATGCRCIETERMWGWAVTTGAIGAALILTKINVGGFVALSALAWMLLHHRSEAVRRWSPLLLLAGACLLPLGLMHTLLAAGWVRTFALMFACSAMAAIIAVMPRGLPCVTGRTVWMLVAAGGGVAGGVLVVVWSRGTAFADLMNGILVAPLKQPIAFSLRYNWPSWARLLAFGSLGACVLAWLLRGRHASRIDTAVAVLRIAAAAGFAMAILRFPYTSPDRLVFALSAPCLWLFLWPLTGEDARLCAARTWGGFLFLGQYLHPFPVTGSQIAWGTFLALPLAAIAAYGAAGWLRERYLPAVTARTRALRLSASVAVGIFAVAAAVRFGQVALRYRGGSDLALPGAEPIRLPSDSAAAFRVITLNAVAHGDMLFSMPGMFSLNLWSGLPTPTLANVTHWFSLLDEARQRAIITALEAHPRACVIVERGHVDYLRNHGLPPSGVLYDFLAANFVPAFKVDNFEFCVRRGRRIQPLMMADVLIRNGVPADGENSLLTMSVLLPPGRPVARIEVAQIELGNTTLALSGANARVEVIPVDARSEGGGSAWQRAWPFVVNGTATLAVHFHRDPAAGPVVGNMVVFRDPAGEVIALGRLQQQ